MATLKTIRKRITSVKNTQKITKAMKMVAAAKLRRAQQAVVAIRPYADEIKSLVSLVREKSFELPHFFFESRPEVKKVLLLVFTSNRGLCGGFNSNILRRTETFAKELESKGHSITLRVVGKKGRDFFKARKREPHEVYLDYADRLSFEEANQLAVGMLTDFGQEAFDACYLAYNGFKSALSQDIRIHQLIPYKHEKGEGGISNEPRMFVDFLYEPDKQELVNELIPRYVACELFRAHRESVASELGARMTAMENATSNAREMIKLLTLQYNRVRQAAITKELMDIVNGAEAIK